QPTQDLAAALQALEHELQTTRDRYSHASEVLGAANARLQAATSAAQETRKLNLQAPCPTCGQMLGDAYQQVVEATSQQLADAKQQQEQAVAAQQALATLGKDLAAQRAAFEAKQQQANLAEQRVSSARTKVELCELAVRDAAMERSNHEATLATIADPHFN